MLTRLLPILLPLSNYTSLRLRFISTYSTTRLLLKMLKRLELWIWLIDTWITKPLSMPSDVVILNKPTIYLDFSLRILLRVTPSNYNLSGTKLLKVSSSWRRVNTPEPWECLNLSKRLSLMFMKINSTSTLIVSVNTTWIPTLTSSITKTPFTIKSLSFMAALS